MKKKVIYLTLTIWFVVVSCSKDSETELTPAQVTTLIPTTLVKNVNANARNVRDDVYSDYDEFARILAEATSTLEFRQLLKEESLKKNDDDYDILYNDIKEKRIVGKELKYFLAKDNSDVLLKIDKIFKQHPLLNISIPVHAEKWDFKKNNLLVAALTSEDDPTVVAYDSKGKSYFLDHKKDPDVPIIVVGYNERISYSEGKYLRKPFIGTQKNLLNKNMKVMSCSYPYRVNNNYEWLKEMKFLDLSQYESWTRGAPEIKLRVFFPQSSNNYASLVEGPNTGIMEPPNRAFINNAWWNNMDVPVFYWDSPTKAYTVLYHFLEIDDSGSSNTFTVGLGVKFKVSTPASPSGGGSGVEVGPTLGYSVTWKATDKEIGRFPIEQFLCPPVTSDNCYQLGTAFQFKSGN